MNKKINILLCHPIISTVIGTVIAGLLLTFLNMIFPSFWIWIVGIFGKIKNSLFLEMGISSWLFIMLLCLSIHPLFKIIMRFINYLSKVDKRKVDTHTADEQKTDQKTKNKYSKESSMLNEEKYILTILTKVDGRALTFSEIQGGINCSNIRTRNAIDKLKRRYLIKLYGGSFHPEAYVLTEEGREFVIGFNLDEKLKNL